MPLKDFIITNDGSFTGVVTDIDGTLVPITLENIIVGSRCLIFKTSDESQILSQEATSSTVFINYNHIIDTDVTIRVRKSSSNPKYLPFETTGIITSNGLLLIINQIIDSEVN